MKNKLKRLQLTVRNFHKKGVIFGAIFGIVVLSLSIVIPEVSTHAQSALSADPAAVVATLPDASVVTTEGASLALTSSTIVTFIVLAGLLAAFFKRKLG